MIFLKYSNEEIKLAFAKSFRTLRNYVGYSLLDMERLTGINNPSLSRYENGKVEPSLSQAILIAEMFDLHIEDFIIYGLGEKPENTENSTIIEHFNETIANMIFESGESMFQTLQKVYPKLNIEEIYEYYY